MNYMKQVAEMLGLEIGDSFLMVGDEDNKVLTLSEKGKPAPDSRRYKALGNGMAHPCASFVLRQIAKAERGTYEFETAGL